MEMEDPLHREILEEHAGAPLFQGKIENFSHRGNWLSDLTGNACQIDLLVQESIVVEIRFSGQGSALSQACASLMCAQIKGMDVAESNILCQNILQFVEAGKEFTLPGDLVVYYTISRFPERQDCSLLAWRAFQCCFEA